MKKMGYLLAAVLASMATPALAQTQSNAGLRIEGVLFFDRVDADFDIADQGRENADGFTYGGGVGYDFPISPLLSAGVDLEISETTANREETFGEVSFGPDLYAGGRVTYGLWERFNIVGKVGYSRLRAEIDGAPNVTLTDDRLDDNLKGIRGAVGLQFSPGEEDRSYYGVEFRFTDYDKGVSRQQFGGFVGIRF
jgi:outer membrane immunogenic protein